MNDRLEIASRLLAGMLANPNLEASRKDCIEEAMGAAIELIRQEAVLTKEESERDEREYLKEQLEKYGIIGSKICSIEKLRARFYELDKKFNQEAQ